jgi:hypothetical protein
MKSEKIIQEFLNLGFEQFEPNNGIWKFVGEVGHQHGFYSLMVELYIIDGKFEESVSVKFNAKYDKYLDNEWGIDLDHFDFSRFYLIMKNYKPRLRSDMINISFQVPYSKNLDHSNWTQYIDGASDVVIRKED